MSHAGTIRVLLTADTTRFIRGMNAASSSLLTFGKSTSVAGYTLIRFGGLLSAGIVVPVAFALKKSIKDFAEFDKKMTETEAVAGGLADGVRVQMEEVAKSVAVDTASSAAEMADAFREMTQAGIPAEQQLLDLSTVATYAKVAMVDLTKATNDLMSIQMAFGFNMGSVEENANALLYITDLLTQANVESLASVDDFANALKNKGASSARLFNQSIQDTVAWLAALSPMMKGAGAGEQFSIMLRQMATASMRKPNMWKGILYDTTGAQRPLVETVLLLHHRLRGLNDEQKKFVLFKQMGIQQRAVMPLMATLQQLPEFVRQLGLVGDVSFATMERFEILRKSFSFQWGQLKSTITNAAISIGQVLAPKLEIFRNVLKSVVEWFDKLADETKWNIIKWGLLTSAVSVLTMSLGVLMFSLGSIMTTIGWFAKTFTGFIGMFGLAGTSIIGMVSKAAVGISSLVGGISHAFGPGGKVVGIILSSLMGIVSFITSMAPMAILVSGFVLAAIAIKQKMEETGLSIAEVFRNAFSKVAGFLWNIAYNAQTIFNFITDNWGNIVNALAEDWNSLSSVMWDNMAILVGDFGDLWSAFGNWLVDTLPVYFEKALDAMWDAMKEYAPKMAYSFWSRFTTAGKFITAQTKGYKVLYSMLTGNTFPQAVAKEYPQKKDAKPFSEYYEGIRPFQGMQNPFKTTTGLIKTAASQLKTDLPQSLEEFLAPFKRSVPPEKQASEGGMGMMPNYTANTRTTAGFITRGSVGSTQAIMQGQNDPQERMANSLENISGDTRESKDLLSRLLAEFQNQGKQTSTKENRDRFYDPDSFLNQEGDMEIAL